MLVLAFFRHLFFIFYCYPNLFIDLNVEGSSADNHRSIKTIFMGDMEEQVLIPSKKLEATPKANQVLGDVICQRYRQVI